MIAFLLDWSADMFAVFADNPPWRIWVALIAFGWYFYANFAGYSDLAIGSSTLLGGDMRPNFDRPYQQTDPSAFWNSWHISLTRFLRTNVFTPIAAGQPERQYLATIVTMLLIAPLARHVVGDAGVRALPRGLVDRTPDARSATAAQQRARPVRIAKAFAVFFWFVLSLPLLQLDLDAAIDFYRAMVGL